MGFFNHGLPSIKLFPSLLGPNSSINVPPCTFFNLFFLLLPPAFHDFFPFGGRVGKYLLTIIKYSFYFFPSFNSYIHVYIWITESHLHTSDRRRWRVLWQWEGQHYWKQRAIDGTCSLSISMNTKFASWEWLVICSLPPPQIWHYNIIGPFVFLFFFSYLRVCNFSLLIRRT